MEHIEAQQSHLQKRSSFFKKSVLCDRFFTQANRVNCLVPIGKNLDHLYGSYARWAGHSANVIAQRIDGGRKVVYGTDNGIYLSDRKPRDPSAKPRRVLDAMNVTQIDVLEEYQLLLVLANKTLLSFSLESLDTSDALAKRPRKIQNHANFFKAGVCLGRHLVCCVKTSALSSTIKVFEPLETTMKNKKKPAFSKMFQGGQDALRPFKVSPTSSDTRPGSSSSKSSKSGTGSHVPSVYDRYHLQETLFTNGRQEFYIPAESSSIHFLKNKLCVGCAKGFEVVSLETLETQSLLDQADTSLDFVQRKENIKPIHIERLNGEFLLNYTDYSFFVNRNGWRAKADWKITWEGQPVSFALSYPYILAFEPSFIEIRNVETSGLEHILTEKNIRLLHSSTREVVTHSPNWRPCPRPSSHISMSEVSKDLSFGSFGVNSSSCLLGAPPAVPATYETNNPNRYDSTLSASPWSPEIVSPAAAPSSPQSTPSPTVPHAPSLSSSTSTSAETIKEISQETEVQQANRWRRQILYAYEDEGGEDVIASLDFWAREEQPPLI